jgi:SAM-dependent methyltransferase
MVGDLLSRRFDRRYGVDTGGELMSDRMAVVGEHGYEKGGADFISIPERTFFRTLKSLPMEDPSGFAFIDIGCGKGRAVLLAGTRSFRRGIGVEHSPTLAEVANRNIETWRGPRHCGDVRVICADATVFELPPEPCVLYFNGPFDDYALLEQVLANVTASWRARPRPIYAVYLEAVFVKLPDEVMRAAGFHRLGTPVVSRFDPGFMRWPQWYAVYEHREPT